MNTQTRHVAVAFLVMALSTALPALIAAEPASRHELTISGTRFQLNGQPFAYTGLSFFNAIYNPAFNQDSAARAEWFAKFRKYGINALRVWCQWDNKRGFVDGGPATKNGPLPRGPATAASRWSICPPIAPSS